MNDTTNLNIRVDKQLKKQSEEVFSEFGFNMTTAVNMFLKQVVRERGIPFQLSLKNTPNAETRAAIREVEAMRRGEIKSTPKSVNDFFDELEND